MDREDQERRGDLLDSVEDTNKKRKVHVAASAFMSKFTGTKDPNRALETIAKSSDESKLLQHQKKEERMAILFSVWYDHPHIMHHRNILDKNSAFPPSLLEKIGIPLDRIVAPGGGSTGWIKRNDYHCPETALGLKHDLRVKKYRNLQIGDYVFSDEFVLSLTIPLQVVGLNAQDGSPVCIIPAPLAPFILQVAPGLCMNAARDCHGRVTNAQTCFKELMGLTGECYCAMNCGAMFGKLRTNGLAVIDAMDCEEFLLDGLDDGLSDHARTSLDNSWGSAGMAGPAFGRKSYQRKEWEYENKKIRILCLRCNAKRTYLAGGAPGTVGSRPNKGGQS